MSGAVCFTNARKTLKSRPYVAASYPFGAPPIAAKVGSFMNSAAAISPPMDFVYARNLPASPRVHTPSAPRVPGLIANEVTIFASTARANSTTPFHCGRLSTPLKPAGGALGAGSDSAK